MPTRDNIACRCNDTAVNTSGALNWAHTFSPTFFNEVLGSYAHTWRDRFTGDPNVSYIDQFGLPNPFKVVALSGQSLPIFRVRRAFALARGFW